MDAKITLNKKGIRINGKYTTLLCSSLFYFRIPQELWRDRIKKLKKLGYNCVDVYFPWNYHETSPGDWRFEGNADADAFLGMLAEEGMFVIARPGPYICSEWDGGGIPAWILTAGYPIREPDKTFLDEVAKWYAKILPVISSHEAERGGTVILLQVENELDFFDCPDPASYMESLRKMAVDFGISVPITGCAGQGSVLLAMGNSDKLVPTFNCYPEILDSSFDDVMTVINKTVNSHDLPFMITETSGNHFLLRRELANGAKLLGAYNQVGGINFGFTNSINNWGTNENPLSLIATEYCWANVINSYGEYTENAFEGRLLASFIAAFGDKLASAAALENSEFKVSWDNDSAISKEARQLKTADLESFLCVPNFRDKDAIASISRGGLNIKVTVPSHTAPFFGFDLKLDKVAAGFEVLWSSAEIIGIEPKTLLCYGGNDAQVHVKLPDGFEADVSGNGSHTLSGQAKDKFKIVIMTRQEALEHNMQKEFSALTAKKHSFSLTNGTALKGNLEFKAVEQTDTLYMEPNGIYRGFAQYDAVLTQGKPVVIGDAADFVSAYAGNNYIDTRVSCGTVQKYNASQAKDWRFRVESWGHCNFDDSRLPSLRMTSKKGIGHIYSVNKTETDMQWRFVLCGEWLPKCLNLHKSEFDAILTPDSWSSTRAPLLTAYYTSFVPDAKSDAFALELCGNSAETALYVDGKLAGVFNPRSPWIDISGFAVNSKACEIALLCRKRDCTQQVGQPVIYHMKSASAKLSSFSEAEISSISADGGVNASLPLRLNPGETAVLDIDMDNVPHKYAHAYAKAADLKFTAVFNGRIIGRIIGEFEGEPSIRGGDPSGFYIPEPWYLPSGNRLSLLLEGIGKQPELTSIKLIEVTR